MWLPRGRLVGEQAGSLPGPPSHRVAPLTGTSLKRDPECGTEPEFWGSLVSTLNLRGLWGL